MGQVLYALGDRLDALVDVTIVYPADDPAQLSPTLWDLLTGRIRRVVAVARWRDIPTTLRGRDFRADLQFRDELEAWMTAMWEEKDALLDELQKPDEDHTGAGPVRSARASPPRAR